MNAEPALKKELEDYLPVLNMMLLYAQTLSLILKRLGDFAVA